jgi:hypothetical protein
MTVEDDEVLIDNLETKLLLAKQGLERCERMLKRYSRLKQMGISVDQEVVRGLKQAIEDLVPRIGDYEKRLEQAVANAGKPEHRRKG